MRPLVYAALLLLMSCNKEPKPTQEYLNAMKEADAAFRSRDADAQVKALEMASASCVPKDCAYTKFSLANALRDAERPEEAISAYKKVAKEYPKSEEAPKALVTAAKLCEAKETPDMRDLLYEAIKLDSTNVAGSRAVDLLLQRAKERGIPEEARTEASRKICGESPACAAPTGLLAAKEEMTLLLAAVSYKEELTSMILYRRADIYDELGDPEAALADEKKIIKLGKKYPQYDDASWRAAQRHIKKNELTEAKKILEVLLETRHNTWLMGSTQSQYLDDSMLLIGDLCLQLGDLTGAKTNYENIFKYFKQSILQDDALWKLANLEGLPMPERCTALKRLQTEQVDSRFFKKSQELSAQLCPTQ
jgi:tetratricopeptide (TPR) repeat protein